MAAPDAQVDAWVATARRGERDAFERLIAHFQDRVWRRARYRIGDADEAWDVAQEVFILCFRKIDQFRGEASFWTWLARIVDNQVRNRLGWLRRRGREITYSLDELGPGDADEERAWDPPDTAADPRREAGARQKIDALNQALAALSEDHREVLLLRFSDGLAYEEIAETLGISLGTVKSRINRARAELRQRMEPYLE